MRIPVVLLLLAVAGAGNAQLTPAEARVVSLFDRSNYVFAGTIKRMGASNLATLKAASNLAVVHVDALFASPAELRQTGGSDITIQLTDPHAIKEGGAAVFYTNVGAIGSTLGVVEVARDDAAVGEGLRKDLSRYERLTSDLRLTRRLDQAELVISGTVARTERAGGLREKGASEHAPDWWIATIEIRSVEKPLGSNVAGSVRVAFPRSDDEHWMESPKFAEGETGIWILRPFAPLVKGAASSGLFTALNPLDFQPISQLERIRALLKQPVRVNER